MSFVRLCPEAPHYLEFRGKLTPLITSAEHYGALLNLDFDYVRYLDTMAAEGLNQSRVFSGTYREIPGTSFGITHNTLAPGPGRFICPWARSSEAGYVLGGNKFDLTAWDMDYFARLRDLVRKAGERNIVLEIVLFCYLYNDDLWRACPQNAESNVNRTGEAARNAVYTVDEGTLLRSQEDVVRRIVSELRDEDNIYYEIMNEPYCDNDGSAFLPWQAHIAEVIADTEKDLSERHLVAQNFRNRTEMLRDVDPLVSICNFHYAEPSSVHVNYHLGRAIADDETGFKGNDPTPYRREAWCFMLAGGAIFSHLDYSFVAGKEDGTHVVDDTTPGIGGPAWRAQLKALKGFLSGFDLRRMQPHTELHPHAHGGVTHVLADVGRAYAVYLEKMPPNMDLKLMMPRGAYSADWIEPATGRVLSHDSFRHSGGVRKLPLPAFDEDCALKIISD